ncbi:hemerythrin domain-containing protein [Lysobacter olei]
MPRIVTGRYLGHVFGHGRLDQAFGGAVIGLIRKVLGSEPESPPRTLVRDPAPPVRSPRAIAYDAALVPALKRDHGDLIKLYTEIGNLAMERRYGDVPARLTTFKTHFEGHLIAENVRFYNYVENSMQDDPENLQLIRSFRREMNSIARGVVDFVKKYQINHFDQRTHEAFLEDYRAVGALLAQRIEREESSLYPLYQSA